MIISESDGRQWLSNWRGVRVGIEASLTQIDSAAQPQSSAPGVDTREYPLGAPVGTPSPLREAFESVARALFDAAEFRRQPWYGSVAFRELARGFADRVQTADRQYANAELQLQAVAEVDGCCAHQEALAAIRGVNDAIGHVVLRIVPDHMAIAHLQQVPAPEVGGLLRRMRQQVSRAAHAVRTPWGTAHPMSPASGSGANVAGGTPPKAPPAPSDSRSRVAAVNDPPIDETALAILMELRDKHPVLVKNVDLEAATNLSKQPVTKVVTELIGKNLVIRPEGKRKGATVTPEGIALVDRIRKSSVNHP